MPKHPDDLVESVIRNGCGLVALDRPGARNALNLALLRAICTAVADHDTNPEVRVIVLTGGQGDFSAGADIDMLGGHSAASYATSEIRQLYEDIRRTKKPIIAAVSGYCLGGGCEIALACDYVIASETAQFGQPEIKLGFIPGAGGTQLWAQRAGATQQAEAALRGQMIDAFAARRLGLVNKVVPAAVLLGAAQSIAESMARQAPMALNAAKSAMRARWKMPLDAALDHEVPLMANLLASSDAREGIAAFLEKRPARFTGA